MVCRTCGQVIHIPIEPPIGTWVKDRYGAATMRHENGNWASPGMIPLAKWEEMWEARGPLVVCGPYGAEL